jgi:hypothetical protein
MARENYGFINLIEAPVFCQEAVGKAEFAGKGPPAARAGQARGLGRALRGAPDPRGRGQPSRRCLSGSGGFWRPLRGTPRLPASCSAAQAVSRHGSSYSNQILNRTAERAWIASPTNSRLEFRRRTSSRRSELEGATGLENFRLVVRPFIGSGSGTGWASAPFVWWPRGRRRRRYAQVERWYCMLLKAARYNARHGHL